MEVGGEGGNARVGENVARRAWSSAPVPTAAELELELADTVPPMPTGGAAAPSRLADDEAPLRDKTGDSGEGHGSLWNGNFMGGLRRGSDSKQTSCMWCAAVVSSSAMVSFKRGTMTCLDRNAIARLRARKSVARDHVGKLAT